MDHPRRTSHRGAIFWEEKEPAMPKAKTPKSNYGGAREGAGCEALFGEKMRQFPVTMTPALKTELATLGEGNASKGVRTAYAYAEALMKAAKLILHTALP
jgi:hypothetical protein